MEWAPKYGRLSSNELADRTGDYVFPELAAHVEGEVEAIRNATGSHRAGSADLGFAVRQLVEVAVRALSPGINDPYTAMSVLDRLGAALSDGASAFCIAACCCSTIKSP